MHWFLASVGSIALTCSGLDVGGSQQSFTFRIR